MLRCASGAGPARRHGPYGVIGPLSVAPSPQPVPRASPDPHRLLRDAVADRVLAGLEGVGDGEWTGRSEERGEGMNVSLV
jgi:hypothetical protein